MDFFKNNPFVSALAIATLVLGGAAAYFAYVQAGELTLQTEDFDSKTTTLRRLQSAKPFPNAENLVAVEQEVQKAEKILGELAALATSHSAPLNPNLTANQFQDTLNAKVAAITRQASEAGVRLPDDFYLGFGQYQAHPPSVAAAPLLGQQLIALSNVVELLIKAGVEEIQDIRRPPLPVEGGHATEGRDRNDPLPDLVLAPFDIVFVADQSNFRSALSSIIQTEPVTFVRLVSITNSQPVPPTKGSPSGEMQPADGEASPAQIPVVFGQENLTVELRLAAISTSAPPQQD